MNRFLLVPLLLAFPCTFCQDGRASTVVKTDRPSATVRIRVDPHTTRSIGGESELVRKRYFSICDGGRFFDRRCKSPERYRYLTEDLRVSFGRSLGPVRAAIYRRETVREDPERPGFIDREHTRRHLDKHRHPQSDKLVADFAPDLDVVAHGSPGIFPAFMGRYLTDRMNQELEAKPDAHAPSIPQNTAAAAELSADVFKYAYDDFTRPRYYEPINEPHWSFLTHSQHLADWHVATMETMHAEVPGVQVGGPCNSVGYFYSQGYQSFNGIKTFIDATGGKLDFYSFHVYDYYRMTDGELTGAILSGLPLEGVLDLVPNYTHNTFGKATPLVISETGGYLNTDAKGGSKAILRDLAREHGIPGEGFDWEMKVRSIHDYLQVSSTIANTLAFMEHPHTVKKAVPFILLETSSWDPEYYSTLYALRDFDRNSTEWVSSSLHDFYRLFAKLDGRRVKAACNDPDVQTRAFVQSDALRVVANNLSTKPETLGIEAPEPKSIRVLRYRRRADLTPELIEESAPSLAAIPLGPRETIVVTATYAAPLDERSRVDEQAHYGSSVVQKVNGEHLGTIPTPSPGTIDYATLRIGYNRPAGTSPELVVTVNGQAVTVPVEDAAPRYTHQKHGYSTTKLIPLDPDLLKDQNTIAISFPDGKPAIIGSTVIRAARPTR